MTKTELVKYIEEKTSKEFPNLQLLSLEELKQIKQLAVDAELFWTTSLDICPKCNGEWRVIV